jgi:hypothetical protein
MSVYAWSRSKPIKCAARALLALGTPAQGYDTNMELGYAA